MNLAWLKQELFVPTWMCVIIKLDQQFSLRNEMKNINKSMKIILHFQPTRESDSAESC